MPELSELIEQYRDRRNLHSNEGNTGVANLESLVNTIGYGHAFKYGEPIHAFLSDNPGAIEAIIEWIAEQNCQEWKESLESQLEIIEYWEE